MPEVLYDGNDNVLRVQRAYSIDLTTGDPVYLTASATVAVTLLDTETGEEVDGETWPLALTYLAGSQGGFLGILRDGLTLTPGQALTARVTLDNGADQYGQVDLDVLVIARRA